MRAEAQRIAIAEACGFTELQLKHRYGRETEPMVLTGRHPRNAVSPTLVPDYLNSLDAMHEAEKVLTVDQRISFPGKLTRLLGVSSCEFAYIHATAPQRAEAFLRTKNLWIDHPAA